MDITSHSKITHQNSRKINLESINMDAICNIFKYIHDIDDINTLYATNTLFRKYSHLCVTTISSDIKSNVYDYAELDTMESVHISLDWLSKFPNIQYINNIYVDINNEHDIDALINLNSLKSAVLNFGEFTYDDIDDMDYIDMLIVNYIRKYLDKYTTFSEVNFTIIYNIEYPDEDGYEYYNFIINIDDNKVYIDNSTMPISDNIYTMLKYSDVIYTTKKYIGTVNDINTTIWNNIIHIPYKMLYITYNYKLFYIEQCKNNSKGKCLKSDKVDNVTTWNNVKRVIYKYITTSEDVDYDISNTLISSKSLLIKYFPDMFVDNYTISNNILEEFKHLFVIPIGELTELQQLKLTNPLHYFSYL